MRVFELVTNWVSLSKDFEEADWVDFCRVLADLVLFCSSLCGLLVCLCSVHLAHEQCLTCFCSLSLLLRSIPLGFPLIFEYIGTYFKKNIPALVKHDPSLKFDSQTIKTGSWIFKKGWKFKKLNSFNKVIKY